MNDKFPIDFRQESGTALDNEILEKIIHESPVPKSPDEKLNHLLSYLHSLQEYEGADIEYPNNEDRQTLAKRLYFKNYNEMTFYLFTLAKLEFIEGIDGSSKDGKNLTDIHLTYNGLARVIELIESGDHSNRCFVAMSFSKELNDTRSTIKEAINEAGFQSILIDEIYYNSDITINDAIVSEIKKCKFLVADFTQHKHGVYFESGLALGLKRPVIYMCDASDFSNTHFDTNHYPHIIYDNTDELKNKLKTKIEAWIK